MSNSMMMRRREMLAPKIQEILGEFTAGYAQTIIPDNTSEWVITHNLGVMPKFVSVVMVGEPTINNYGIFAVYELDVPNMQNDKTGFMAYRYHYNNADSTDRRLLPNTTYFDADSTQITLKPVYSVGRSPWDTGAAYHVQVYA